MRILSLMKKVVPIRNYRVRTTVIAILLSLLLVLTVTFIFIVGGFFFTHLETSSNHPVKELLSKLNPLDLRSKKSSEEGDVVPQGEEYEAQYGIYSHLFTLLANSKPSCDPLLHYEAENEMIQRFVQDDVKYNKKFLSSLLGLSDLEKSSLFESYQQYMAGVNKLALDVFGDELNTPIKGNGIVIVGGSEYSWLALLSIHQLRKTGSNLPVEVYIPSVEDYDDAFCTELLPALGAKCIRGYEVLPLKYYKKSFKLKTYENKLLALLTSSFENILLLDADNVVLHKPDGLFDWDIYKQHHLVLWPDCWIRTTNPFVFDLFHIDVDYSSVEGTNDYDIHDLPGSIPNPSTESGMLLVNKRSQVKTLFLALYLNIYGLDYYYPLISQGSAGEGDKDTYIVAAFALKQPVYQVKETVTFLGYFDKANDEFISGGLGQCNPMTEHEIYLMEHNIVGGKCSDFMFIHLSNPKYFPDKITVNFVDKKTGVERYQFDNINTDFDFELQLWEIMTQLLCAKYTPNTLQEDNTASALLDPIYRLSANGMKYIQKLKIEKICSRELLPHLKFLRKHFKSLSEKS